MTTEEVRRRARQELGEVVSMETADYLLDRPAGGWDSLATKQDLEPFATKQDLEPFATKQDLEPFATRRDLEGLATKKDLDAFATKQDLAHFGELIEYKMSSLIDRASASQLRWTVGTVLGLGAVMVAAVKI